MSFCVFNHTLLMTMSLSMTMGWNKIVNMIESNTDNVRGSKEVRENVIIKGSGKGAIRAKVTIKGQETISGRKNVSGRGTIERRKVVRERMQRISSMNRGDMINKGGFIS